MKIVPVIMAGGAGTRLWPLSREEKPKQYHNLSGDGTLLEETIKRLLPLNPEEVIIATSKKYTGLTREELNKFNLPGIILAEPRARNTAAAILYAAEYLQKKHDDSIMIVLPADHFIKNPDGFIDVLKIAIDEAEKDILVTIGIKPTYPETGYGYIKSSSSTGTVRSVDKFVEKPDIVKAEEYFKSASYFWNSGIFVWKTSTILKHFDLLMPDHVSSFSLMKDMNLTDIESADGSAWEKIIKIFNSVESISIDYGILEKAEKISVIPGDFGWADLGSWKSIDDILDADKDKNRSPNPEKSIFLDSSNCSVFSEKSRISVIGLSNIVVIEAGGEILILDKDSSQEVKKIVDIVKNK